MCILVTGGFGFIGSHICQSLADEGEDVVAYGPQPREVSFWEKVSERVTCVRGDVTNLAHLLYTIKTYGVKGVIHTAAIVNEGPAREQPYTTFNINVTGTVNMLETARIMDLEKVVDFSTVGVYGPSENLSPIKEDQANPYDVGLYGATKFMSEVIGLKYLQIYGIDFVAIRPTSVYGPGRDPIRSFRRDVPWDISSIVANVARGKRVVINQGGDHPIDWVYVKDLVRGILSAYEKKNLKYHIFNIGSGKLHTFYEISRVVKKLVPDASLEIGPGLLGGEIRFGVRGPSDISRAREELGYEPRYDLERGLSEWLRWFRGEKIY